MAKKHNKYVYLYVLQGYYGYGWDTSSENYHEIRQDYRDYRDNEPSYAHRVIQRRVLNA